ncbi:MULTISPECIES: sensor histidine kinase [Halolamina]|uniref:histidine kinase n=1 Tax=Halolamina pelagica TaxID=699431 RepID=A0A1I5NHU4_9EURY|nr:MULTISPECIES: histidine kinase N-terminal 7TM domain-containing protein [Halolamina]NHX36297.1 histidine kinase [Halolamina sp. R1-12]SFP20801.1 His Kinase A (phospho-acceptor) domain-containing protein [Halolamina pelagica]
MDSLLLAHVGIFAVSAVACLLSLPRAFRIKHPGTRRGLIGLLLAVALWSLGYVGYLVAPTDSLRLTAYTVGFIFAFVAVAAWTYFCAAYTGRRPRQAPYRRAMVGVFLLFVGLKLTNPLHHLYFTTEWTTDPFPHLAIQHGLLYWVTLGLSYAVIAVGFFMLLDRFYHTGTDSRPLIALAVVTGLPAVATILGEQVDWLLPLMYEPPGVAVFAVGTLFVYVRRFEAVQLTGGSDAPAVFLDRDERVRDFNQAAATLFPALRNSIGQPVDAVDPEFAARLDDPGVFATGPEGERRYYQLSVSPFTSGSVTTGQLVTINDVTEQEAYRRRLEEKTEQLEALNRVVRHDIRNDMAVIRGWAETLSPHVDEEGRDALDRVLRKSDHVIELTETVREFVESLSGEHAPEPAPTDLRRHLETELEAVRETFPDAEFRVAGDIPTASVLGGEMLSSVFRNLLGNAVRHNDSSAPEVTVEATEHADTVEVRVADNGPGVPDDQKERIFGKGEKGLDSPGSGIGLYLVHTLTEQFGGEVRIEDNEPRGAVFVVELVKADAGA